MSYGISLFIFINPLNKSKLFITISLRISINSMWMGLKTDGVFIPLIIAVFCSCMEYGRDTYRFSAYCDFLIRVFFSTHKNKWLFAGNISDWREITKNESSHKVLNVSSLHFEPIFPPYNKHRFSMWYSPFRWLKCSISRPKTGIIRA